MPSYRPEVIADSSGKWAGNAQRFATQVEAQRAVKALEGRWTLVTNTRVVQSADPVNCVFPEGADRERPI